MNIFKKQMKIILFLFVIENTTETKANLKFSMKHATFRVYAIKKVTILFYY